MDQNKPDNKPDVEDGGRAHKAGALDIRNVIGVLLSAYGVILVLMGIFADAEPEKTGDVNANLWAGLVMLVVGVGFLVWVRLRPLVVPHAAGDRKE